jgi:hypothetical protein
VLDAIGLLKLIGEGRKKRRRLTMMENDGKHFKRLKGNVLSFPEHVFPINHHNIRLFASVENGEWAITEQKTGYRISGTYPTMEEAIKAAEELIEQKGINETKKTIKEAYQRGKEGLVYDEESGEWVSP